MTTFTRTAADEAITPALVSSTVTRFPAGGFPSNLADTLSGGGGNDYLNGGPGEDSMAGGGNDSTEGNAGNDTYVVDSAGDVVTELAGNGTGRAYASVNFNYVLGDNVENLYLSGTTTEDGNGDNPFAVDQISNFLTEAGGAGSGSANIATTQEENDVPGVSGENLAAILGVALNLAGSLQNNQLIGNALANEAAGDLFSPLPTYTINEIADYLKEGFWDWFGPSYYCSFNMGTSGNNGFLYYNYSGFSGISGAGTDTDGLTTARQALVDDALDYLGEILGINFVQTTATDSKVDIFYKDNDSGAYSNAELFNTGNGTYNHRYVDYAWVNVEASWSGGTSDINDYTCQTIIHETLHCLGLGHSGPYNGTVNYITDTTQATTNNNNCLNDSWQMSIMSYIDQVENTTIDADFNFDITAMAADIEALRDYYGSSAFTGNTTYGFNTNISAAVSEVMADLQLYADETSFCIIDDGGTDTVDFSGYTANQKINLAVASGSSTTGSISDIGGQIGNMTIGVGTVIENAIGGSGDDDITGNDAANILTGGGGNDHIFGSTGNDTLDGGAGNDTMYGSSGGDTYVVDSLGDVVAESSGNGTDTVQAYVNLTLGANVENLALLGTAAKGYGNSLNNRIDGNSYANTIYGYDGDDVLYGHEGNDLLAGGKGNDYLMGGPGNDDMWSGPGNDWYVVGSTLDVIHELAGNGTDTVKSYINYTLAANVETLYVSGTATDGTGNTLNNVIYGNSNNNNLKGLKGYDILYGYDGNDYLFGGPGDDTMYGGTGDDTYVIGSLADVVVENAAQGTDTIQSYLSLTGSLADNVENLALMGSAANGFGNSLDNIINGNVNANTLQGLDGHDQLYGYEANDIIYGGFGNDSLLGGTGNDTLNGGAGADSFFFANSGSANYDTIADFSHIDDTIRLQDNLDAVANGGIKGLIFSGGVLSSYFEGTGFTGNGLENSGIFNNLTTGNIYYNPTSNVAGDAVLVCTIGAGATATLANTDFHLG